MTAFDFKKWRKWLHDKAVELQSETVTIQFTQGPDDGTKPGTGLGIATLNTVSLFENWITGETDYTIHVLPSMKLVSHKWGVIVNDDTFETTFN